MVHTVSSPNNVDSDKKLVETIADAFHQLQCLPDREEKNSWLDTMVPLLKGETWHIYRAAVTEELSHIHHVRTVMAEITKQPNTHDWSKDQYYFFITIAFFKFGERQLVQEEFTIEVNRHYTLEPHHPEYELMTGRQLYEDDIMEMAIDRLSRNFQRNDGQPNMEQMRKFEPKFHSNQDKNLQLYWKYVGELTDLVQSTYRTLTKDNEESSEVSKL